MTESMKKQLEKIKVKKIHDEWAEDEDSEESEENEEEVNEDEEYEDEEYDEEESEEISEYEESAEEINEEEEKRKLMEHLSQSIGEEEEPEEEQEVEEPEKNIMFIYSRNCLQCSSLVSYAKKAYEDCHYSNGNELCPASEMNIMIGTNFEKAAAVIRNAFKQRDAVKIARLMKKLSEYDPVVQDRVMSEIENG